MPIKKYRITIRYQGQELTGQFKGKGAEFEAREWYAVELGTNYENIEIVKTELITSQAL